MKWQDDSHRLTELRWEARACVYVCGHMDDEPTLSLYLPSAAELALAYPAPACGTHSSPIPRVNDEVLVFSDMGVMTNVHVSDPRRQELLKIRGRKEHDRQIQRVGDHVRIEGLQGRWVGCYRIRHRDLYFFVMLRGGCLVVHYLSLWLLYFSFMAESEAMEALSMGQNRYLPNSASVDFLYCRSTF